MEHKQSETAATARTSMFIEAHAAMSNARQLKLSNNLKLDEQSRKALLADYCSEFKPEQGRSGHADASKLVPISFLEEAAVVAAFGFVMGAFFWVPALVLLSLWRLPLYQALALWAAVLVINSQIRWKRWPPAGQYSFLSIATLKYFSYRGAYEELPDPTKPTILAGGPHGLLPIGNVLQILSNELTLGFNFHGLGASAAFMVPVYGHMFKLLGLEDVSKQNVTKLLVKKQHSVGLVPGGIAEMFTAFEVTEDAEFVVIKSRKGFIKLALETGAQVVPCYLFGNTQIFHFFQSATLRDLSRRLKIALTFFWGRWRLPIPYRQPVFGVVGRPFVCPVTENPSAELIDKYHEMYTSELKRIFDTYKGVYGWENKTLIMR